MDNTGHTHFKMAPITEMFKYYKCIFELMVS